MGHVLGWTRSGCHNTGFKRGQAKL